MSSNDGRETLTEHVVGPYIIRHEIGRGGMGVVYLADDTRLSRRVALKALPPGVGRDPARRERLRQEARAAAGLTHPGIATVYALEEFDGELYLAFEFVPGQTLRAAMAGGALPMADVLEIAIDVARALAAAHAHGIVHRDLKPENIIRTPAGAAKILDFGIARVDTLTPARLTQTGTVLGTPGYMAPEQVLAKETDFRTDLFSFGVLLYEMASGSNPFEADTVAATIARILELEPGRLSEVCPSSVPKLDRLIANCLRKDPLQRHRSTHDVVAELQDLQAEAPAIRKHRRRPIPASPSGSRIFTPRWWWQFHQLAVSALYASMIYPAWRLRMWLSPRFAILLLFVVVACAVATTSLRMNLLFTARNNPADLASHRARTTPWTRVCDVGFALAMAVAAFGINNAHAAIAALLVGLSVAVVVASLVIEPNTTRSAFRGRSSAVRTPAASRRTPSS
jgi:serine/threonine protein kinase